MREVFKRIWVCVALAGAFEHLCIIISIIPVWVKGEGDVSARGCVAVCGIEAGLEKEDWAQTDSVGGGKVCMEFSSLRGPLACR